MSKNLVHLLYNRECNYVNKKCNFNKLKVAGEILVENDLLQRIKIFNVNNLKTVNEVTDQSRSIYSIEFSDNGKFAAVSHTNRTVSIIKVSTMKKVAEISTRERTVWSMAFHSSDTNILATGSLGGVASVFKDSELYRSIKANTTMPISSICFHIRNDFICFAAANTITLWDWENNKIILELSTNTSSAIRYVRFNPVNDMLITGISKVTNQFLNLLSEKSSVSLLSLLKTLLRTVTYIINCLEGYEFSEFPILKDFHLWNFVVQYTVHELEFCEVPKYCEYDANYPIRSLDSSLQIFHNRLESINDKVLPFGLENLDSLPVSHIDQIMNGFRKLNGSIFTDNHNNVYKYEFNEELLKDIITQICAIVYSPNKKLIDEDLNYYYNDNSFREYIDGSLEKTAEVMPQVYAIQVWDLKVNDVPEIDDEWHNVITNCSIHNDSSVAISKCGKYIVTLNQFPAPKGEIEVRSLEKYNLGVLLHKLTNNFNIISLSISPSSKYIVAGVRALNIFAAIYCFEDEKNLKPIQYISNKNVNYNYINCLKWGIHPGDGIMIGYQNHYLRYFR